MTTKGKNSRAKGIRGSGDVHMVLMRVRQVNKSYPQYHQVKEAKHVKGSRRSKRR